MYAEGERSVRVQEDIPQTVIALVERQGLETPGVLYDAIWDREFSLLPLEAIARNKSFKNDTGEVVATTTSAFRRMLGRTLPSELDPSLIRGEQSNTSIIYGETFILKFFRRLEAGMNPDLEMGRYLTEQRVYPHTPPVAGSLEYRDGRGEPVTLAILQGFVRNEGDAWSYTLDTLGNYFEHLLTSEVGVREIVLPQQSLLELTDVEMPGQVTELIDLYLGSAQLLGQRTAELHAALSFDTTRTAFTPEPFTAMYQRSIYQTARSQTGRIFQTLRRSLEWLPENAREDAQRVADLEGAIIERFQGILNHKIESLRIRCHGDYHLGQVLYTGDDFMIIDFEGEPVRSLTERRRKRSALTDVAGMLRSFHYAAYTALFNEVDAGIVRAEQIEDMEQWARFWYVWVASTFLKSYLATAGDAAYVPTNREETSVLLKTYLLDKAIYELGYELNNRPTWVRIPLWGILQLLET